MKGWCRRFVGVALKTVDFYGCVGMTALTKISACHVHTATGLTGMAFNAGFETVFRGADATAKRVIALVFEQVHMVTSHECRVLHAFVATCCFNDRLRYTAQSSLRCRCVRPYRGAGCQQQGQTVQTAGHTSPPAPSGCSRWGTRRRRCGNQCTCCSRCPHSAPWWTWIWAP